MFNFPNTDSRAALQHINILGRHAPRPVHLTRAPASNRKSSMKNTLLTLVSAAALSLTLAQTASAVDAVLPPNDVAGFDGTTNDSCPGQMPIAMIADNGRSGNTVSGAAHCIGGDSANNTVSGIGNSLGDRNNQNTVSGVNNRLGNSNSGNTVSGEYNSLGYGNNQNTVSGAGNSLSEGNNQNTVSGQGNSLGYYSANNDVSGQANRLGNNSSNNIVSGVSNILLDNTTENEISGEYNFLGNGSSGFIDFIDDAPRVDVPLGAGPFEAERFEGERSQSEGNILGGTGNAIGAIRTAGIDNRLGTIDDEFTTFIGGGELGDPFPGGEFDPALLAGPDGILGTRDDLVGFDIGPIAGPSLIAGDNNTVTGSFNTLGGSSSDNTVSGEGNSLGNYSNFNTVGGQGNSVGDNSTRNEVRGESNFLGNGTAGFDDAPRDVLPLGVGAFEAERLKLSEANPREIFSAGEAMRLEPFVRQAKMVSWARLMMSFRLGLPSMDLSLTVGL